MWFIINIWYIIHYIMIYLIVNMNVNILSLLLLECVHVIKQNGEIRNYIRKCKGLTVLKKEQNFMIG